MKSRFVGYIRVSTKEQANEGLSLEAQRARLTAAAIASDFELVDIFVDAGESAKSLDRPGLRQALMMLRCGEADGLVVVKLDRLTRRVVDLGTLLDKEFSEKGGKLLVSLGESIDTRSAGGRLMLNILMSVAQWELEAIGERTRDALRAIKDKPGVRLGGEAYGWRRAAVNDAEGRKCIDAAHDELAIVEHIVTLSRKEGLGVRAIAARLESEGVRTKKGQTRWQPTQVQRILKRAAGA
jgi:DNA invertase Pin-like site-specific DNA recombinase